MSNKCELTGITVMSGNNVSKSKRRTKRNFLPNLKEVSLKSDVLNSTITLKIAANTLRTINKYGNLDSFIINYRGNKLTDKAKKLRKRIEKALIQKGIYKDIKIISKRRTNKKETEK